jgi:acyl dehydratase
MIAFLEQRATFRRPVFKDDTVRPEFEIQDVERQVAKEWGTLKIKVRLINQHEETVLEARHVYRIRCKRGTDVVTGAR